MTRLWWTACVLAVAGCATAPVPPTTGDALCEARYFELDKRTDQAGVRDAGTHRVAGFPYLRVDRFLASFAGEVQEVAAFDAWVSRMRALDLAVRRVEVRNLGDPASDELLVQAGACGAGWAQRDLARSGRREALVEAAEVPDDYSLTARIFGLYPLTVPLIRNGVEDYNEELAKDYATPVRKLAAPGPLVLWRMAGGKGVAAAETAKELKQRDALGIPQLSPELWQRLAVAHAPSWWIEEAGPADRPGTPKLTQGEPTVDMKQPATFFQPGYTRWGDDVLVQMSYVVWFSERPKFGVIDSYAGALDAVVWRVTLDDDGRPLLYDTIHACGCYHYFYAAKKLTPLPQDGYWEEPVFFPQARVPAGPLAVRLQSGTHYVRRIVALDEAKARRTERYALAEYEELLSLPDPKAGTRSLFGQDGIVKGTNRLEQLWLWPSGVKSPGAMRQAGRQATSLVGRTHFDDPRMLERIFGTH